LSILTTALSVMGFTEPEYEGEKENQVFTKPDNRRDKVVSLHPQVPLQQPTIILITPKTFDDVKGIGDQLKSKVIVGINLTKADAGIGKRILDFASGVVYGLDGHIMKLGDNVYLCSGHGVIMHETVF